MQRKIIITFIILFIASSMWLFWQNQKQTDPNAGSAWWSLEFDNPKDNSLSFTIENHSDKTNFHWEIATDTATFKSGNVNIDKGNTDDINLSDFNSSDFTNKKISVKVSADSEMKEIYKNF